MTKDSLHARLQQRLESTSSHLCVGIDPRPDRLPPEFSSLPLAGAFLAYGRAVVEETAPFTLSYKLQSAFFEALGPAGVEVYYQLAREIRERGIPTVGDCKRGDIGSTAKAYADAAFGVGQGSPLAFDAITVNPYFGYDGLQPFFSRAQELGGLVFVLVKTSNPTASEFQDRLLEDGRRLHECVADHLLDWTRAHGLSVGAVVGATQGNDVTKLRQRMPDTWILLPGVGAQGAGAEDAARARNSDKSGVLVNLSRGITEPWGKAEIPQNWREHIADAARRWHRDLHLAFDAPIHD